MYTKEKWFSDLICNEGSKVQTYRLFKQKFNREKYLCMNMSAYAKFRCGVAPLRIETGPYKGFVIENRLWFHDQFKENNIIEDERHVLLNCPVYADLHAILFSHAGYFNCNFCEFVR